MTIRRIRWTIRASRRLDQIAEFIAQEDEDAASRVVARLVSAVEILAEFPAAGRTGRIAGTREMVLADIPYIIPYRVAQDIQIITILHTSRKWPLKL